MKNDKPLVSVIIPTYNSASTIEQCLKSVKAQTYPNIEVIIVDNFSNDGTDKIASTMASVIQAGPERSAQVNIGASHAHGAFLYRIDGDMLLDPTVVQACVETVAAEGYDAIAVPNRSQGEGYWARVRTLERDTYLDDPLIVAARFFKREAFEAIGGMDETLVACEDYDLHNRLVAAGYRIGRITPTEFHLGEAESLWDYAAQSFYYGPSVFRYLRKHPRRGVRQMFPLRSAYLRHWQKLVKQPLLLMGLILLKLVQYISAALGISADSLGMVAGRGRVARQALAGMMLVLLSSWALVSTLPDFGIHMGTLGSWALIAASVIGWQLVGRVRSRRQEEPLFLTLLDVGLAFSPLLLILVTRPEPEHALALETWRVISILMVAISISWLTYLTASASPAPAKGMINKSRSLRIVQAILLAVVVAFVSFYSMIGLKLLHTFSIRSYDLAAIDQALWASINSGAGNIFSNLLTSSIYERSIFAYDAAPAMLLLLPAYAIGLGGPELLLISQILPLGLGAIALFRLGKDQIGPIPAMLITLGYLTYFLTVRLALGRFIMLTWSIPLFLFAVDAYRRRRIVIYYILVTLALACGLDAAWALAAWGLYLILVQRERTHGLITLLLGVTWLGMAAMVFVPFFGGTAGEALGWADLPMGEITLPGLISRLLRPQALSYLWGLLTPTGFLPVLGAPLLLPAAPRLILNLLVDNSSVTSLNGRYEIILLPFIFAAIIFGIDWLAGKARKRNWAPPQLAASVLILVASICTLALHEPDLASTLLRQAPQQEAIMLEAGRRIIREIPAQASVATQSPFAIALAHRKELTVLPQAQDPDFIFFDVFHPNREPDPSTFQMSLMRTFQNPLYGLRSSNYGYLLFERGLDPETKLDALVTDTAPDIQYARRVELSDTIAYLGFDMPITKVRAGESVYITHYWQSLLPTSTPYLQFTAFPGAQRFEEIALGAYTPEKWGPGDVVYHRQLISLPVVPDGDAYEMVVGLWFDEGEPALLNPDQLLGRDVIRIATISASGGSYEIHPWLSLVDESNP